MSPTQIKITSPKSSASAVFLLAAGMFLFNPIGSLRAQTPEAMTAFMKTLTPDVIKTTWAIPDDPSKVTSVEDLKKTAALKELLLTTFEGDWFKAKDCLLFDRWPVAAPVKPIHATSLLLMQQLVNMRGVETNLVEKDVQARLPAYIASTAVKDALLAKMKTPIFGTPAVPIPTAVQEQLLKRYSEDEALGAKNFVMFPALGAQKMTSDIDIASGGPNTEIGVQFFNSTFRTTLGVKWDPATVFDYNVYASDWIFRNNFITTDNSVTPRPEQILKDDAGAAEELDKELQAERAESLAKVALLKFRRNATEPEWIAYMKAKADSLGTAATALAARNALAAKLVGVNNQYRQFEAEVKQEEEIIRKSTPPPASAWPRTSHFYDEETETLARNRLYEGRLLKVKDLRLYYNTLKAKPVKTAEDIKLMKTLALSITEAISEALYFANEVYASEGATLHAVVAIQMATKTGKTANLTKEMYLQAFLENVGDSLHSLDHYKTDPTYAAYRAGKYIDRMLKAGDQIGLKKGPAYAQLEKLAEESVKVKASNSGDDPVAIAKDTVFIDYEKKPLADLRSAILSVAGDAPDPFPAAVTPSAGKK